MRVWNVYHQVVLVYRCFVNNVDGVCFVVGLGCNICHVLHTHIVVCAQTIHTDRQALLNATPPRSFTATRAGKRGRRQCTQYYLLAALHLYSSSTVVVALE